MPINELGPQTESAAREKWPVVFSPLTFILTLSVYQMILMPIAYLALVPQIVNLASYEETFLIWCAYLLAVILGWRYSSRLGQSVVNSVLSYLTLGIGSKTLKPALLKTASTIFLVLFFVSFAVLMVTSGAGLLWITSSRTAYANYKTGVGFIWIGTFSCLLLSYMFTLFFDPRLFEPGSISSRTRIALLAQKTLPYCVLVYFLGSKQLFLTILITALMFYNYVIGVIRPRYVLLVGLGGLSVFVLLQVIQGTAGSLADAILYGDYFNNTSLFLQKFNEFGGLKYGEITLSGFWTYVPRALVPNKPEAYGTALITEIIHPGAIEVGYFPGMAPWAGDYLDFGFLGVLRAGLAVGMLTGWVTNYFQAQPSYVIRFLVFLDVGAGAAFPFVPVPFFLLVILPLFCLFVIVLNTFLHLTRPVASAADTG